jgi:GTP diphosphokinase / guanosine-3',5'-bis(diphosphate) 3'-diphosphatase
MGTSVEPQPVAPNPASGREIVEASLLAQENHLLTIVRQYMAPAEVEQVSLALQLAQDTCKDVHDSLSPTSIPPLEHALAVATILAEMHIDAVGVAAGLLFEAVDAERLALERVENILGPAIARVVGSMLRLNILERKKQAGAILARSDMEGESSREQKKRRVRENLRRLQAETVRKMFFAMAEDPRVVLLKLAYRLHAMRLIQAVSYPVDHQDMLTMAQETREIYAPLAGRLGMARVESELEDLAFAILEPEKYEWIRNQVELESQQWRSYVDRVCAILREEMAKLGLHAEVSGRVKHLYSFYQKLKRTAGGGERLEDLQAADFSQIHDLIAFRILVESTPDCYLALGHVHSLWKPKEGRIKDFIANPKPNGYRALHTTVFCLDDWLVEIQIRTRAMHEMAEYGVAMHWHYKDVGDHASASAKELLTWLRQLADWQRDLRSFATSDSEFIEAVKDDIFQEQIFVFTPKGEVKDLPIGSTPLDFAYRIHSKIGDRCAGARVTTEHGDDRLVTRMVPLDYELRSGDIVDIMTNRTAHPTRDWLNFARTTAARSKIRRYLKIHERAINIQIGRERLERELKMMNARDDDVLTEENQHWLAGEFRQAAFEDLLAAIGSDEIRPHAAAVKLVDRWQQLREQREKKDEKDEGGALPLPVAPKPVPPARLQVAGVSGLLTRLANCCCPLPGDEIVGFISRGKGAIVHRADCKNIDRYRERERERLINVSWTSMGQQHYLAPIIITARDRSGLIRDIAAVVSEAGVNMTAVNSNVSVGKQVVLINATLEIESLDQMQRLFARIEKVRNVQHVERDLGKGRKT